MEQHTVVSLDGSYMLLPIKRMAILRNAEFTRAELLYCCLVF